MSEEPRVHKLKVHPEHFGALCDGRKTCEIRKNLDRDFRIGDFLWLWLWDKDREVFLGMNILRRITWINKIYGSTDYDVLSLGSVEKEYSDDELVKFIVEPT